MAELTERMLDVLAGIEAGEVTSTEWPLWHRGARWPGGQMFLAVTLRALSGRGLIYGERDEAAGLTLIRANDAGRSALAEANGHG